MEGGATQVTLIKWNKLPQRSQTEGAMDEKVIVRFRIREAKEANIWRKGGQRIKGLAPILNEDSPRSINP